MVSTLKPIFGKSVEVMNIDVRRDVIGQYESALLTLNSCPMFTYNERDLHRMPTPARTHLPVREFIKDSGVLDEDSARDNEVRCARRFSTFTSLFFQ